MTTYGEQLVFDPSKQMKVYTTTPLQATKVLETKCITTGRNSGYRGEMMLACRTLNQDDSLRYIKEWESGGEQGKHPVDWAVDFAFSSAIFARARMKSVTVVIKGRCYQYNFSSVELLDQPIYTEVRPNWWHYSFETGAAATLFPLSPEQVQRFYDVCEAMDRGEVRVKDTEFAFLLTRDPRARQLRKDILRQVKHEWVLVHSPNWRVAFKKNFDFEVPKLIHGQNYAKVMPPTH